MPDKKISQLPPLPPPTPTLNDLLALVNGSTTYKVKVGDVLALAGIQNKFNFDVLWIDDFRVNPANVQLTNDGAGIVFFFATLSSPGPRFRLLYMIDRYVCGDPITVSILDGSEILHSIGPVPPATIASDSSNKRHDIVFKKNLLPGNYVISFIATGCGMTRQRDITVHIIDAPDGSYGTIQPTLSYPVAPGTGMVKQGVNGNLVNYSGTINLIINGNIVAIDAILNIVYSASEYLPEFGLNRTIGIGSSVEGHNILGGNIFSTNPDILNDPLGSVLDITDGVVSI